MQQATPVICQSKNLDEAVGSVHSTVTPSSALVTGSDEFIAEYKKRNDGAEPSMSEAVKVQLDHGRTVKPDAITRPWNLRELSESERRTLFGPYDQNATTFMIFPRTRGRHAYRTHLLNRKELFNDIFTTYAFGYLMGCLDYTLPPAEVPYLSEVTGQVEYLPASISLIWRSGTDLGFRWRRWLVAWEMFSNERIMAYARSRNA